MHLLLLDAIGPFFRGYGRKRVNWSKIPFAHLERDGAVDQAKLASIRADFRRLCSHAVACGANALSLDDVAHLVPHPLYPAPLAAKIDAYRAEFGALFDIAADHGLRVFVTTDVLYSTPELDAVIGRSDRRAIELLAGACARLLDDFPQVGGVILRLGECDAKDVDDDFKSRLRIKTARQARRWLRALLPVFEARQRLLIVRTWTVGAYPIGDLIWHRGTFARVFDGLDSTALVISLKYGESDFFRYLPLNAHFFRSPHRKLVELQARREYEGCGEYPSFVGYDYERYRQALAGASNVRSAAWCGARPAAGPSSAS
jgi:hypothetical protein